ncbi:hypothetical protein H7849_17170 [Alloacidobacterium dinghuense]|uniref:Uncharacterized protein n=1 Tax=Alloacidobacterium dinghuense TaxID=2763107 RepID=A0A7G8BE67_9BACT|nr:hypothetical protein [Alloacidobacterium dinghuense]QNI30837.1 hypothetical protein H7849_17170 [Alloacidobacterium dinghuense]
MEEFGGVLDEEEIVERVAEALQASGLDASSQDTGGDIYCVVLPTQVGGEIVWGTADVNWGATVTDESGEIVSSISTTCPSESQDIETISEVIRSRSIEAGAASL